MRIRANPPFCAAGTTQPIGLVPASTAYLSNSKLGTCSDILTVPILRVPASRASFGAAKTTRDGMELEKKCLRKSATSKF